MNEYLRAYNTMGDSGIEWIDILFKYGVIILVDLAKLIGITYEELNVWLFIIFLPLALFASIFLNIYLIIKIKKPNNNRTL
jgi:hypothetical protein